MAFGKPSGPPASHQQLTDLLELLQNAGHSDFRDARGPMGFSQRQAGGKFTRDEAQEFIEQLEEAEDQRSALSAPKPVAAKPGKADRAFEQALRNIPDDHLAAELRRRGWTVREP